jgi:23S rRNA pseudouridine1911/1915/1917 synthase
VAGTVEFEVAPEEAGERFDVLVARHTGVSRAAAARIIEEGAALAGGASTAKAARLPAGTRVRASLPEETGAPAPEERPVPVVYEDASLLVVSKPAGLVVHPAPGNPSGTLVNALLARAGRPAGGAAERPGIVHRLDAGTSGLMVVAKTEEAYERLVRMMASRDVARTYLALVEGDPREAALTIDAPVGRSARHRKRMAVVASGRPAVTRAEVRERFGVAALLEVRPETGRTHQIRVHLAAVGHPVVGDRGYGRDRKLAARLGLTRPFLHAAKLAFAHPLTGERLSFEDPLPEDLAAALRQLRPPRDS